jgi:hypothetical protein
VAISAAAKALLRKEGDTLRLEARKMDQNAYAAEKELEKARATVVRLMGEVTRYQRLALDYRVRAQELELDAGITR